MKINGIGSFKGVVTFMMVFSVVLIGEEYRN